MVLRFFYLVLFLMSAFHWGLAQSAPASEQPTIEDVYLAKDDGNGKPGEPVTEFRTSDIPIHCVIVLESAGRSVIKMVFMAVNVAGVKTETKVVTSTYSTTEGQNRVNFTGRPEGKWVPGKYRVDLFVNNKLVTDIEFSIRPDPGTAAPRFVRSGSSPKPRPAKQPAKL